MEIQKNTELMWENTKENHLVYLIYYQVWSSEVSFWSDPYICIWILLLPKYLPCSDFSCLILNIFFKKKCVASFYVHRWLDRTSLKTWICRTFLKYLLKNLQNTLVPMTLHVIITFYISRNKCKIRYSRLAFNWDRTYTYAWVLHIIQDWIMQITSVVFLF